MFYRGAYSRFLLIDFLLLQGWIIHRFIANTVLFAGVDNSQIYRKYSVVSIPYRGA